VIDFAHQCWKINYSIVLLEKKIKMNMKIAAMNEKFRNISC